MGRGSELFVTGLGGEAAARHAVLVVAVGEYEGPARGSHASSRNAQMLRQSGHVPREAADDHAVMMPPPRRCEGAGSKAVWVRRVSRRVAGDVQSVHPECERSRRVSDARLLGRLHVVDKERVIQAERFPVCDRSLAFMRYESTSQVAARSALADDFGGDGVEVLDD